MKKIKITIEPNTKAEKIFKDFMAEREAFRKAAQEGTAISTKKPKKPETV